MRGGTTVLHVRAAHTRYLHANTRMQPHDSSRPTGIPPAAIVGLERASSDPRAAPLMGERVPYVVLAGEPNAIIRQLVVSPEVLLNNLYVCGVVIGIAFTMAIVIATVIRHRCCRARAMFRRAFSVCFY